MAQSTLSPATERRVEFERQLETLLRAGYPDLAGLDEDAFLQHVVPLEDRLGDLPADADGRISFVIVLNGGLIPRREAAGAVELGGKRGFTSMDAAELDRFTPLDELDLPRGPGYLVSDLDTGRDTLNVPPDAAIEAIARAGRSPLTIDEGLALLTHHPNALREMTCFSVLGSRCGDRRVTAWWLSGGRPRLGWCWAGAPHTWLGSASCALRLG